MLTCGVLARWSFEKVRQKLNAGNHQKYMSVQLFLFINLD